MIAGSDPWVDRLLLRASVSGRFLPSVILADAPERDRERLAGELSLYCEEDPGGAGRHWILQPAVRRQLLGRLDRPISVQAALDGAPPSEPDDLFGQALRSLLQGKPPGAHPARRRMDATAETARHSALQFAEFAPVVDRQAAETAFDESRARIARLQQEAALNVVLPTRLFGRQSELERMARFARGKTSDLRPMLVTGVGGIGKSALLAAVVRRRRRNRGAAILLDFDRADLSAAHPFPIIREFMRQLETAWLNPAVKRKDENLGSAAVAVGHLRRNLRSYEAEGLSTKSADEQYRFVMSITSALASSIPQPIGEQPLLLVLDSFEVVGVLGPDVVQRVLELEAMLRADCGLSGLRTIVSGRAAPLPEQSGKTADGMPFSSVDEAFGRPGRRIEVGGLNANDGAEFLHSIDENERFNSRSLRRAAVDAVGGNPLALIVLERFARNRSKEEISPLVEDLRNNPEFSAEFAQAFVYTRILERIRDPKVRKLAHPGLVLREVTPDLIRLVLAGPCDLEEITEDDAADLFERLAQEFWLVERLETGVVRHRPDLRRLMLPGLFAGPADSDTAGVAKSKRDLREATIHACEAAARFYVEGPPDGDRAEQHWHGLTPEQRRAEATYYRALAGERAPPDMAPDAAVELRDLLGADFETLPEGWRAVARAAIGRFDLLSTAERESLTGDLRSRAEQANIDMRLSTGQTSIASGQIASESVRRHSDGFDPRRLQLAEQEVRACWVDAKPGEGLEAAAIILNDFLRGEERLPRRNSNAPFWESALWLSILTFYASDSRLEQAIDTEALAVGAWRRSAELPAYALVTHILPRFDREIRFGPWTSWRDPDAMRLAATMLKAQDFETLGVFGVSGELLALADQPVVNWLTEGASGSSAFTLVSDGLKDLLDQFRSRSVNLHSLESAYHSNLAIRIEPIELEKHSMLEWKPILRGLTPELHAPAATLLNRMNTEEATEIAETLSRAAPYWPIDFRFGGASEEQNGDIKRRRYNPRLALGVIETADRCGLLPLALDLIGSHQWPAIGLRTVHNAINERIYSMPPS